MQFRSLVISVLLTLPAATVLADKLVTVETSAGRRVSGLIDARTNRSLLWLRTETSRVALTRAIPWTDIARAWDAQQPLTTAALRKLSDTARTALAEEFIRRKHRPGSAANTRATDPVGRVQSLEAEVTLTNWDRDVEPDGYEVRIFPLDAARQIVPVNGNLSMRLIGEHVLGRGPNLRHRELQRWSERVRAGDFGAWGAVYRFPFQIVNPAEDPQLGPNGLLNIRLGVPGQGNYEASNPTRLRKFERIRGRLQLLEGRRYFRGELIRQPGPRPDGNRRGWRGWR